MLYDRLSEKKEVGSPSLEVVNDWAEITVRMAEALDLS